MKRRNRFYLGSRFLRTAPTFLNQRLIHSSDWWSVVDSIESVCKT